jgi:hypothetical protein
LELIDSLILAENKPMVRRVPNDHPEEVPRIEVRGLQYGWFFLDIIWNLFGSSPPSAKGPRVVAVDRYGNEQVVDECASKREALHTAERLRTEIEKVGARTWGKERNLPGSFW